MSRIFVVPQGSSEVGQQFAQVDEALAKLKTLSQRLEIENQVWPGQKVGPPSDKKDTFASSTSSPCDKEDKFAFSSSSIFSCRESCKMTYVFTRLCHLLLSPTPRNLIERLFHFFPLNLNSICSLFFYFPFGIHEVIPEIPHKYKMTGLAVLF